MQAEGENASQQQDDASTVDNESVRSNRQPSRVGWSGLVFEQQSLYNDEAQDRLKNCITLDNGSTLSLFSNPELVQDIRTTKTSLSLATNAGVKQSNQEAFVPGFGKVFYDKDAIANIFGFSDLKQKHRITYDSEKEDALARPTTATDRPSFHPSRCNYPTPFPQPRCWYPPCSSSRFLLSCVQTCRYGYFRTGIVTSFSFRFIFLDLNSL
jgi:hypothetical protein